MAFPTDADYYIPGMDRDQVVIDCLKSWQAAKIPAPEVLKIMTVSGDLRFEMKDGVFFKTDGIMTPAPFFHSGSCRLRLADSLSRRYSYAPYSRRSFHPWKEAPVIRIH